MNIHEAAKLAIDVQDACNLSGVVRSFAKITEVLWEEARSLKLGTKFVNEHPISVLFASKIASLTGCEQPMLFSQAYGVCKDLSEEP